MNKELTADEMLERLGYSIQSDDGKVARYQQKWTTMWNKPEINFNKVTRMVNFFDKENLTVQELQAINKKVEELKWI